MFQFDVPLKKAKNIAREFFRLTLSSTTLSFNYTGLFMIHDDAASDKSIHEKVKALEKLKTQALEYHRQYPPGKIKVSPTKAMTTQQDLALAYSPGVAFACEAIVDDPNQASLLSIWKTLKRRNAFMWNKNCASG